MPSYYHALMFHTEHLADGTAYLKNCPYCELGAQSEYGPLSKADLFYKKAQESGRKSVPLSEMP